MKRIRDGPGNQKVATRATFFAVYKTDVQKKLKQPRHVSQSNDRLQKVRQSLLQMVEDKVKTQEEFVIAQMQIDEVLQAPMLIWKNGELYYSWAQLLSERKY